MLVEPGNPVALAGGIERALADHERLREAGLARAARYSWAETARLTLETYRELLLSVAAVVIWTPGDPDPGPCLDSLAPQVDELVLTVNPGGSPATREAKVIANERTLGFGANINRGVAATTAPFVIASNSDIEVTPGASPS